jgi:hypothetical protein
VRVDHKKILEEVKEGSNEVKKKEVKVQVGNGVRGELSGRSLKAQTEKQKDNAEAQSCQRFAEILRAILLIGRKFCPFVQWRLGGEGFFLTFSADSANDTRN